MTIDELLEESRKKALREIASLRPKRRKLGVVDDAGGIDYMCVDAPSPEHTRRAVVLKMQTKEESR
jgi:hypothetical protein